MDWSSSGLLIKCLGAFLIYYVCIAFHNAFLGPLAEVPGPFFAKFSGLPSFYYAIRGNRHIWIWQCLQIYGDRCRVAPNTVVFKSAQAFRDIYAGKSNVTRSHHYEAWQRNERDVNTLNTGDPILHHKKRRLLNVVFTEKSVRAAGYFISKHVDRWNQLLPEAHSNDWSPPRNIAEWSNWLVFDILGDLCFGRSFEIKEPGDNPLRDIPQAIHSYMRFTYPMTKSPFLPLLLWLKPRGLDSIFDALTPPLVRRYYNFIEESVQLRRKLEESSSHDAVAQATPRQDMFHFIFQAKDPDSGEAAYSDQELLSEANLLIIAGSDTTSTSLCSFFFYITRNQRSYEKVVQEVRTTFTSADDISSGPKLSSCRYLRACLDESMRLTPAGPSELPRRVLAGGQLIEGFYYPAGTIVGLSGWVAGRSEEFGDPLVYRPERWIPDDDTGVTAEEVARIRTLVNPFSAGPANCVGQNLAILELLTTIARTLYRLDVRAAPGSTLGEGSPAYEWGRRDKNIFQLDDAYISMRDGPMVQFKARED